MQDTIVGQPRAGLAAVYAAPQGYLQQPEFATDLTAATNHASLWHKISGLILRGTIRAGIEEALAGGASSKVRFEMGAVELDMVATET
ncbi:hypothetical protein [Catenulispora sp. MAP12-49]|uniref:hypothetical protein n=1 Tax=Catenulispora sp. MAP12-49 TaxID=3156302 RepID=UPI0035143A61